MLLQFPSDIKLAGDIMGNYLIKVNENDERIDTKSTSLMLEKEIQDYITKGYFLIALDDFNKLIGNTDKLYKISHVDGTIYEVEPPEPTEEEKQEKIKNYLKAVVQNWMDKTVQEREYDGVHTACLYVNSPIEKFQKEGQACLEWMSAVWVKCYAIQDEVLAGTREIPTEEELIAELPVLEW